MTTIGDAFIDVKGNTGDFSKETDAAATAAGKSASSKFAKAMGKAGDVGKSMTKGITLPLVALGGFAVHAADQVGDAMDTIKIGTGATGDSLAGLQQVGKNIATTIPGDFDTVAHAVASLNTDTGASGSVLQGLTTKVLEASRVMGEDGAANADAFGKALNAANIPADKAGPLLDTLFAASQQYGTSMGGMMDNLKAFGPQMESAGFSTEDTVKVFAQFNKAGVSANRIVPSLNAAFLKWSKAGKDPSKMLGTLSEKIKGATSTQEAMTIASQDFSGPGASAFVKAIRSGNVELSDMSGVLDTTGVDILKSGKNTQTLADRMSLLKNKASVALAKFGDIIMPIVLKGLTGIGKVIHNVTAFFDGMSPSVKKVSLILLGVVAAVGPLLLIFVKLVAIGKKIVMAMNLVKMTMLKLNLAFLTNPVFLVVAGIVALVAAFVILWNKSEAFRNFWKAIWDGIKSAASAVADWFTGTLVPILSAAWDIIKVPLQLLWDYFTLAWNTIKAILSGFIDFIVGVFTGNWSLAWDGIKQIFSALWGFLKGVLDLIKQGFDFVWGLIKAAAALAWGLIKDVVMAPVNAMKAALEVVWGGIKSAAGTAWGLIKTVIVDPVKAVAKVIGGIVDGIKSALSTAWGGIKSAAKAAWNLVKKYIVDPMTEGFKTINGWISDVKGALSGAWDGIKSAAKAAWGFVHDYIVDPLQTAYDWVVSTFGKIGDAIGSAFNNVVGFLKKPINAVISGINWVIRQLNKISFHVPSWVPGIGGKGFGINISEISPLAKGGIAEALAPHIVGENGPELFIPQQRGRVLSNSDSRDAVSGTSDDSALLNELKALREDVALLRRTVADLPMDSYVLQKSA